MSKEIEGIDDASFDTVAMEDPDFLRHLVERALQRFLEAEMTAHLHAARYERSEERRGPPQRLQAATAAHACRHVDAARPPGA